MLGVCCAPSYHYTLKLESMRAHTRRGFQPEARPRGAVLQEGLSYYDGHADRGQQELNKKKNRLCTPLCPLCSRHKAKRREGYINGYLLKEYQ